MSYSASNPPIRMAMGVGTTQGSSALTGNNRTWWSYASSNLSTDLLAANFFANGYTLGMRPGDMVMGAQYTSAGSSVIAFTGVVAVASTTGAVSLSTGGFMSSTFRSS